MGVIIRTKMNADVPEFKPSWTGGGEGEPSATGGRLIAQSPCWRRSRDFR